MTSLANHFAALAPKLIVERIFRIISIATVTAPKLIIRIISIVTVTALVQLFVGAKTITRNI